MTEDQLRICVFVTTAKNDEIESKALSNNISRNRWLLQAIDHYLTYPDAKTDQEQIISLARDKAVLEERARGYEALIAELKANKTHNEGLIQSLMSEQNRLLTDGRTSLWSRWFGGSR